jgi:hypothetical protein
VTSAYVNESKISGQAGCERYHPPVTHAAEDQKIAAGRRAAIERTGGMFAHLAPGERLSDELISDRRAEVHAEELREAEQRRRRAAS